MKRSTKRKSVAGWCVEASTRVKGQILRAPAKCPSLFSVGAPRSLFCSQRDLFGLARHAVSDGDRTFWRKVLTPKGSFERIVSFWTPMEGISNRRPNGSFTCACAPIDAQYRYKTFADLESFFSYEHAPSCPMHLVQEFHLAQPKCTT